MGSQVTATCKCGLNTKIMIGGGMANFMTTCYFPCLCELCFAVVQVNLLDGPICCPSCKNTKVIPYDDPTLVECAGEHTVADWDFLLLDMRLKLTDGNYKCPQCNQMTLHFADSGLLWD